MTEPSTKAARHSPSKELKFVCGEEGLYTLDTVITKAERLLRTSSGSDRDLVRLEVKGVTEPWYRNHVLITLRDVSEFMLLDMYRLGVRTERDLVGKPVRAFYMDTKLIGVQGRE